LKNRKPKPKSENQEADRKGRKRKRKGAKEDRFYFEMSTDLPLFFCVFSLPLCGFRVKFVGSVMETPR
jgi:hypothetical protein